MGAAEDQEPELTPQERAEARALMRALRALVQQETEKRDRVPVPKHPPIVFESPSKAHEIAVQKNRRTGKVKRTLRPPETPGVYAIRGVAGYIKIGRASNIAARIGAIQSAHPIPIKLLAILSENPEDEAKFHRRWAEQRVGGEWFKSTPEMLEYFQRVRDAYFAEWLEPK